MARNITISVPDELHEEIQQAKGSIKVSAICQEALSEAIKIYKAIQSEDILALREKFKMERKNFFQPYWDEGFKDGQRDAFLIDYTRAKNCLDSLESNIPGDDFAYAYESSNSTREKFDSIQSGTLILDKKDIYYDEFILDEAADTYLDGWEEAMRSILKQALS